MVRDLAVVVVLAACSGQRPATPAAPPCAPTAISPRAWAGQNRDKLVRFADQRGCTGPSYDAKARPVAMFDWDNTVVKNDFGDAVTFYSLAHDKFIAPPSGDWKQTSRFLTDAAAAALAKACADAAPGRPLHTSTNAACADEILAIYDGKTTTGAPAFAGNYDHRRLEAGYAWMTQLHAGRTPDELRRLALEAIEPALAAPEGATQTIGTHRDLPAWVRFYDEQRELIAALISRGFDVWVITASPQDVIKTFAPRVGIAADHVIGVRLMVADGKLTYHLEGCGPIADGDDAIIPYVDGKRCFVNKVVFGDRSAAAIDRRPDGHRWAFAAGDSDSDASFVRDAELKLVIDRHKSSLMCLALRNEHDSWLVNPMFIQPMPPASAYACASTACSDPAGTPTACVDDAGAVIPDRPQR
jgi:phosphoserine phosphatase